MNPRSYGPWLNRFIPNSVAYEFGSAGPSIGRAHALEIIGEGILVPGDPSVPLELVRADVAWRGEGSGAQLLGRAPILGKALSASPPLIGSFCTPLLQLRSLLTGVGVGYPRYDTNPAGAFPLLIEPVPDTDVLPAGLLGVQAQHSVVFGGTLSEQFVTFTNSFGSYASCVLVSFGTQVLSSTAQRAPALLCSSSADSTQKQCTVVYPTVVSAANLVQRTQCVYPLNLQSTGTQTFTLGLSFPAAPGAFVQGTIRVEWFTTLLYKTNTPRLAPTSRT